MNQKIRKLLNQKKIYNSIKIGNNFENVKNSSEQSYNNNDMFNSEKEYLENILKKFK